MSTRVNNPVGPSSSTPTMAVHPAGAGTEVPGPVPDIPAAASPAASVVIVGDSPLAAALRTFMGVYGPQATALASLLTQASVRIGTVRGDHLVAAPLLAALLRNHSDLAPGSQPETIENGLADYNATQQVISLLKELLGLLQDTGKQSFDNGWSVAMATYRAAERAARRDKSLAIAIAPVQSVLSKGPRAAASSRKAQAAQFRATAAQQRAATSQQQASAAGAAASRAHAAAAARPHKVIGTSPVPLANPQGPAASADVAPQGPAPSPVPGTGR